MDILKASGEIEKFDKEKIYETSVKAGASKELARRVAKKVEKEARGGMKTQEIHRLASKLLKKEPGAALRYHLKQAIMELGPSGFPFEKFFAAILKENGYKVGVGVPMKGKVVVHEVDVLARKNESYMIECKFHNHAGIRTDSKVALYTYARFLDLKSNKKNLLDRSWLVTNTRCTSHAINYAKGVGLKITSWRYSTDGENLQKMIQKGEFYPITLLRSVKGDVVEKLSKENVVLVRGLMDIGYDKLKKKVGLDEKVLKRVFEEAEELLEDEANGIV